MVVIYGKWCTERDKLTKCFEMNNDYNILKHIMLSKKKIKRKQFP